MARITRDIGQATERKWSMPTLTNRATLWLTLCALVLGAALLLLGA